MTGQLQAWLHKPAMAGLCLALWGVGLSLLAASPSEGATITLIATADGEVSDQEMEDGTLIKDGIFETVNADDDFLTFASISSSSRRTACSSSIWARCRRTP